jgi:hypothetical protein
MNVNNVDMVVTNHGALAYDLITGGPGLVYPKGTGRTAVFASGLWIGARVDGITRVAVAEYGQEYVPGPMRNGSFLPDQPDFKTYTIRRGDITSPDYLNWPVAQGAPLGTDGKPLLFGDVTMWSVYNDADPGAHGAGPGRTSPLGVEVRQTVFAYNRIGPAGNTIFVKFTLINKGVNTLDDAAVAFWVDPDLGGASDDLVGCDPALNLGYVYNGTNSDDQYGAEPPAVGVLLIQGAVARAPGVTDQLGMTSFTKYINGMDPLNSEESYALMRGLHNDGTEMHEFDDPARPVTKYAVSGDPVAVAGWLDSDPGDRRMVVSSGTFSMAPGDVQEILLAITVGQGTDRLSSISALRAAAPVLAAYANSLPPEGAADQPPVVAAPATLFTNEGQFVAFDVTASDPDGDAITSLTASPLPPGATFDWTAPSEVGHFSWTPGFSDAGSHTVTFTATSTLSASVSTTILVQDIPQQPVADAGGPYFGVVNVPVQFDGTKSYDPDGDPLDFLWTFGDSINVATGPTPQFTYTSTAGSPYIVELWVSDGVLADYAATTATIVDVVPANVFFALQWDYIFPQILPAWLRVEPANGSFSVGDIVVSSTTMSYGGTSIRTACKGGPVGDINHNGVRESRVCFARRDLKSLFADLPDGVSMVTVTVSGELITGGRFSGDVAARIVKFPWLGAGSLATVTPNPLNPEAKLRFVTTQPGPASVRIFGIQGRLVRTLLPRQHLTPGVHEATLDGRDNEGRPLASGVYYYRLESPDGVSKGAFTVLK